MIIVISNLLVGFSGAEPVRGREKERERRGGDHGIRLERSLGPGLVVSRAMAKSWT